MNIFTRHPAEVGESYGEHMTYAATVGITMILAGLACMIHGILPFLFKTTGSNAVARLHNLMMEKRRATYADQVAAIRNPSRTPDTQSIVPAADQISLDRAA